MNCIICGSPVLISDYCSNCGLKQDFLKKAFNTSNYYYNVGLDRASVRDLTGAIDVLKLSLKYNKRNTEARNLLGLIYYEMGETVEALSHWVVSTHYDENRNRASLYLKSIQSSAAKLESVNQLAKRFNQTLIYAAQNNKDIALIQLKRILGSYPHFVKGFLLLALLYIDAGNYDKAKKALKRVLKIDKNNTLAIKYMYGMEATPEEIIKVREDAAKLNVDNEEGYDDEDEEPLTIGEIVEEQLRQIDNNENPLQVGKYKEMNFSKHTLVYVIVGLLLGALATYFLFLPNVKDKIDADYKQEELVYTDEIAKKNLTITNLESKIGSLEESNDKLTKELDSSPADLSAAEAYERLIAATNYYNSEDKLSAAVELIGISEAVFTSDTTKEMYNKIKNNCFTEAANKLFTDGKELYDAGDYEGALEAFKKSVSLNEESEDGLYYLAMTYELNNLHDEASQYFTLLNEKFPESEYHNSITQYLQ